MDGQGNATTNLNWLAVVDYNGKHARYEKPISSETELLNLANELVRSGDETLYLHPFGNNRNREYMLIGIKDELAFVQFVPCDPTHVRVPVFARSKAPSSEIDVGFNVGGTLTEIPLHRCIPSETVLRVCRHYFSTLALLPDVSWEPKYILD